MRLIDLRSDTVTRPSSGMRQAMASAEVGDDVYGEDPTVRRLEERVAELVGHPAALFVPSSTLANQLAVGIFCRGGDELLAEAGSHVVCFEGGAVSALWGAQPRTFVGERGLLRPEQVTGAVRAENDHLPRPRLLVLENTHNRGGGKVWPLTEYRAVVEAAKRAGLRVHLDGARLFNAQASAGSPVGEWGKLADTVSVCFSKGLGAPVGSALAGSAERIREARRLRKRLGGGMRQAGILAAGALYALEHNVERLRMDHDNARRLADGLAQLPGCEVLSEWVETNFVFASFGRPAAEVSALLKGEGVLANAEGSDAFRLRFVTHLDVSREDVDEVPGRIRRALGLSTAG